MSYQEPVRTAYDNGLQQLEQVYSSLNKIESTVTDFGFTPNTETFSSWLSLGGVVNAASAATGSLLTSISEAIDLTIDAIVTVFGDASNSIFGLIKKLYEEAGTALSGIGDITTELAGNVMSFLIDGPISWIQTNIGEFINFIKDGLIGLPAFITDLGNSLFSGTYAAISGVAANVWTAISGVSATILNHISGIGNNIWGKIAGVATTTWDYITGSISSALGSLLSNPVSWLEGQANNIYNALIGIGASFGQAVDSLTNAVTSWYGNVHEEVTDLVNRGAAWITDTLGGLWTDVAEWISDSYDNVVEYLGRAGIWAGNALTRLGEALGSLGTQIQNALGPLWTTLEGIGDTIWTNIRQIGDVAWGTIRSIGNTVWTSVKSFFEFTGGVGEAIKDALGETWDQIQGWLTNAVSGIREVLEDAGFWAGEALTGLGMALGNLGDEIGNALGETWDSVESFFTTAGQAIWNSITGIGTTIWAALRARGDIWWNSLTGIGSTLFTEITNRWTAVNNWVSNATSRVQNILAGAGAWTQNMLNRFGMAVNSFGNAITGTFQGAWRFLSQLFSSDSNSFSSFIQLAWADTNADNDGQRAANGFLDWLDQTSDADHSVGGGGGANINLSNLGSGVAINRALNFAIANTVGGNGTRSIGYSNSGDLFLKVPGGPPQSSSLYDSLFVQHNDLVSTEVKPTSIILNARDTTNSDMVPGEFRRVGNTIHVRVQKEGQLAKTIDLYDAASATTTTSVNRAFTATNKIYSYDLEVGDTEFEMPASDSPVASVLNRYGDDMYLASVSSSTNGITAQVSSSDNTVLTFNFGSNFALEDPVTARFNVTVTDGHEAQNIVVTVTFTRITDQNITRFPIRNFSAGHQNGQNSTNLDIYFGTMTGSFGVIYGNNVEGGDVALWVRGPTRWYRFQPSNYVTTNSPTGSRSENTAQLRIRYWQVAGNDPPHPPIVTNTSSDPVVFDGTNNGEVLAYVDTTENSNDDGFIFTRRTQSNPNNRFYRLESNGRSTTAPTAEYTSVGTTILLNTIETNVSGDYARLDGFGTDDGAAGVTNADGHLWVKVDGIWCEFE